MSEKHPMTCGHMSDSDKCPYDCPDSIPVEIVVIEAETVESPTPEQQATE